MRRTEIFDYFSRLAGVSFSHPTETKIWNFRNLADGWHSGEGVQFKERDILDGICLHSEMLSCGFIETDAFPGFNGEIQITLYSGEHYFEFTLEPDGKWTFAHERRDEEIQYKELLTFQEAIRIIRTLHQEVCNTFAFFHAGIGMEDERDFRASLSNLHPQMEEFPVSTSSALLEEAATFVTTSAPITIIYPTNPLYFGNLTAPYFRRVLHSLPKPVTEETSATETSQD